MEGMKMGEFGRNEGREDKPIQNIIESSVLEGIRSKKPELAEALEALSEDKQRNLMSELETRGVGFDTMTKIEDEYLGQLATMVTELGSLNQKDDAKKLAKEIAKLLDEA